MTHLWLVADSHVERHAAAGLAMGEGEALREKACDVGAGTVGGGGQIADTRQVGVGVVDRDLPGSIDRLTLSYTFYDLSTHVAAR